MYLFIILIGQEKFRKLKRGFATKRKAQEWEQSFLRTKAASMDMTFYSSLQYMKKM